jgi:hypothetical protein
MYALIHNSQLLLGPIKFNYRLINADLENNEIEERIGPRDYENVPLEINSDTFLLEVVLNQPEFDERSQVLKYANWQLVIDNGTQKAQFNYDVVDKSLEQIKAEYKQLLPDVRKTKENQYLTITINGTDVFVLTTREQRTQFINKLSSLGTDSVMYKFDNNTWASVGKADIEYIVQQIDLKVQEAFDWEYSKIQEIDSCTTKEEVFNVVLVEPPVPPGPPA